MFEGLDLDEINRRLPDEFSELLLAGAIRVASDETNPIRGNLFASAIRELLNHTMHTWAPDEEVLACGWFEPEAENGKPTRAQRQRYIVQGGLPDSYISGQVGLDITSLRKKLKEAVGALNKATHVRPGTVVHERDEVAALGCGSLSALQALFEAIDEVRLTLMEAVVDDAIDVAEEELLRDTIQSLDEIASHHFIEEVYVNEVKTVAIDAHYVWYEAVGTISATLQYGSGSDVRRGDGAVIPHKAGFVCRITAPVSSPNALDLDRIEATVDDGGWYD